MIHVKRFAITCTALLFAFTVVHAAKSNKSADLAEKKAVTKAAISSTEIATKSKQAETVATVERAMPNISPLGDVPVSVDLHPGPDAAHYVIPWQSINGGGGPSSSTNYSVNASVGQSTIGSATSTNYEVGIGYWYGVEALTGCTCPTHGDPASTGVIDVFDVLACVAVAFQNGAAFADAGCPFENTDIHSCDGDTDVFDVLLFVFVAFQNGTKVGWCDPCS